jgi:integrase
MKDRLTNARALALPVPAKGRLVVWDERAPGLCVRVTSTGSRSWYACKRGGSRIMWTRLGDVASLGAEDARRLAAQAFAKVLSGDDPNAEKRAARAQARGGAVPILDATAKRMDTMKDRGRSEQHRDELERVAKDAHAAGVRDLADPGIAAKADKWLRSLDVSDMTRHRYRTHLIAIGKEALRWWPADILAREPFAALSGRGAKMPAPPVFTPAEAMKLASDDALALHGGPLWYFLLATGCRWKEATWARWDRVDLERRTFQIVPPDAAEHAAGMRVKRSKSRTVELQPELIAVLRGLRPADGAGFLFAEVWRTQHHRLNVDDFRAHLDALEIQLDGRRIHALRHAHACIAIAAGVDSLRLRLGMGHAGDEMAAHYSSQAMRWRGLLASWEGTFRLRDPAEVRRINGDTDGARKVAG